MKRIPALRAGENTWIRGRICGAEFENQKNREHLCFFGFAGNQKNRENRDSVFGALKDPLGRLRKSPFVTLNTIASIYYLAPVILVLAVSGVITGRGEVLRLYVSRSKGAVHGE